MIKSAHKLVIRNIGLILSGALEKPILDGDTLVSLDSKIAGIGYEKDLDTVLDVARSLREPAAEESPGA